MKLSYDHLVLVVLLFVVNALAGVKIETGPRGTDCIPSSLEARWRNDCNWCSCSDRGFGSCTRMACIPGFRDEHENKCEGDAKWKKDDCNWCNCIAGQAVCQTADCAANRKKRQVQEKECEVTSQGAKWRNSCNWCRCIEPGVGVCTRRGCPSDFVPKHKDQCRKDAKWKIDCNWCHCSDGTAVCTEIACQPGEERSISFAANRKKREVQEKECEVTSKGAQWRKSCNWCWCIEPGVGVCTLKGCPPALARPLDNEEECRGDANWKRDCNWCHCSNGHAVCTEIACPANRKKREVQEKECEVTSEGAQWRKSCNWCWCIEPGLGVCTRKGCPPALARPLDNEEECRGDANWKRDCNWCHCSNGHAVCTEIACPANRKKRQVQEKECEVTSEGAQWRDSCNWCRCLEPGVAVCTRRGCPPALALRLKDKEQCRKDAKWKRDCNWCHCSNGHAVCTKKGCHDGGEQRFPSGKNGPVPRSQESECIFTPRKSFWRKSCNWCFCNKNEKAECTHRTCPPKLDEHDRSTKEDECKGRVQWKKDCNWCTCEYGHASCTKRLCAGESSSPPLTALPESTKSTRKRRNAGVEIETGPRGTDCIPSSLEARWRNDCNWCFCSDKGFGSCTRMACIPGFRDEHENKCEGDAKWKKDDCNWCNCIAGEAICQTADCGSEVGSPYKSETAAVLNVNEEEAECVPVSETARWRISCNWCRCSDKGKSFCTRMACPPTLELRLQSEKECEGNPRWRKDCNWCDCVDGKAVCQTANCDSNNKSLVRSSENRICEALTKGAKWREECNLCSCSDGHAVCTRRICDTEVQKSTDNTPECSGLIRWKKDCNWCECVNGIAVCSGNTCSRGSESAPNNVCKANSEHARWRVKCNWCRCGNGLGMCTKIGCLPGMGEDQPVCQGEISWKRDCNWCRCVDGKGVCTNDICGRSLEKPQVCTEGQTWVESCNTCHCSNGRSFCTRRACIEDENKIEPGNLRAMALEASSLVSSATLGFQECLDGSRWKKNCNWCSCSNGVGACTLMGCPPGFRDSGPTCEEGSVWKPDNCNICTCGKNGVAACTMKACFSTRNAISKSTQKVYPEADSFHLTQTCKNGSRWRNDCNWCLCDNGRGACTKRGCLPGRTEEGPDCEGDSEWQGRDCTWCRCNNGYSVCEPMANCDEGERKAVQKVHTRTSAISLDARTCKDGSRWRSECNWCFCNNGVAACTQKGCLPGRAEKEPDCEGDSEWRGRDCTWCRCDHGYSVCEVMADCDEGDSRPKVTQKIHGQESSVSLGARECKNGSRWRDDCNWCFCSNGLGACTLKGCFAERADEEPNCEGDSEWRGRDCTWCKCSHGYGVCEPMADCNEGDRRSEAASITAAQPSAGQQECKDGSRWKNDCNWCSCSRGVAVCTKKGCLPGRTEEGPQCEGEAEWRDSQCTWCKCQNERAVCEPIPGCNKDGLLMTRQVLSPTSPRMCTEGSSWKNDCNWCSCNNGMALCTLIGCAPGDRNGPSECRGNSEWRGRDCTWCKCQNGFGVCEPMANCDGTGQQTGGEWSGETCNEGNSWKDDCNLCVCTNNVKVCTQNKCPDQPRQNLEPRCTEGESWNDGCNTCACIGRQAACTTRFCLKKEPNIIPALCHLPPIQQGSKLCGGIENKWTFNAERGACEEVLYGGCGGTENLFSTEEECKTTCQFENPSKGKDLSEKNPKERCFLPADPGFCFGFFERYAFNPAKSVCEKFLYGGCQGNQNNFNTPQECYDICGGNPPSLDINCDRSKCEWHRFEHYIAQDCKPVYEGGSCCPTSFSCKSEHDRGMMMNKCYYKGKMYHDSEPVPIEHSCSASCRCRSHGDRPAEIVCAQVECPSLFRRPNPECRQIYTQGQCCSTEICDHSGQEATSLRSEQCAWKNQTWIGGDVMYFDDEPCQKCVCNDRFTDPKGAGCERINCGIDFRGREELIRGCTPMYFEEKCCPIPEWVCPDDTRITGINPPSAPSKGKCKLGSYYSVPVGGSLEISDCKIECFCKTPPDLTCVQYRSCERLRETVTLRKQKRCPSIDCPLNCKTERDFFTDCPKCFCPDMSFQCPEPTCPRGCRNPSLTFDYSVGCKVCKCDV